MEPNVKSRKTCELFNAGVSELAGSAKSADPTCYDVGTVDQDRQFETLETNMIRYTGYDQNGIARVWGQDEFHQTALGFAKDEAATYVRHRPDTGPISAWTYTHVNNDVDCVGSGSVNLPEIERI